MFYLSFLEFSPAVLPSTVDFIAKNVIVDHIPAVQGLLATPNERFEGDITSWWLIRSNFLLFKRHNSVEARPGP